MIKFFKAGSEVPEWLEKQEPQNDEAIPGTVFFNNPTLVYIWRQRYFILPLWREKCGTITWKDSYHNDLLGQSPVGSGKAAAVRTLTPVESIISPFYRLRSRFEHFMDAHSGPKP